MASLHQKLDADQLSFVHMQDLFCGYPQKKDLFCGCPSFSYCWIFSIYTLNTQLIYAVYHWLFLLLKTSSFLLILAVEFLMAIGFKITSSGVQVLPVFCIGAF
jgi:hypothetical protein